MSMSSFLIYPAVSIGIIFSSSGSSSSFSQDKMMISNCEKALDESGTNYTSITLTEKQQQSYTKLDAIAELKSNWNDNGALPFDNELIDRCRRIIQLLPTQPEIFPTAIGAIQFEFRTSDGYLEFEIFKNTINEYRVYPNGEDYEKQGISFDEMKKEVESFYE